MAETPTPPQKPKGRGKRYAWRLFWLLLLVALIALGLLELECHSAPIVSRSTCAY